MIETVRAVDVPAGRPAVEGNIRAIRVVQYNPGVDTIAFNNAQQKRIIYAGTTYRSSPSQRIEKVYLTGTPIIEYTTDSEEEFDASSGTQTLVTRPSYVWQDNLGVVAGSAFMTLALEAGPAKTTKLRYLVAQNQGALQTAAGFVRWVLGRTTAPSTGGSTLVPAPQDPNDPAFSGICRRSPTTTPASFLTVGQLLELDLWVPAAQQYQTPIVYDLEKLSNKPIIIPAGVNNGVALYQLAAVPGAVGGFTWQLYFTED